jgi:hypothetical protein
VLITPWQLGVDRDSDTTRPKEWKLYDLPFLPLVSQYSYHDSAGVNSFPANIFLGDRALIAVVNTKLATRAYHER